MTITPKELYDTVVAAKIPIDHHESDLYILVTEETDALIRDYEFPRNVRRFVSPLDGQLWYDVPFGYMPFWDKQETLDGQYGKN